MPRLVRNLAQEVEIKNGFPGRYKWKGGRSYYLNGNSELKTIHFSINDENNEVFEVFHVTYEVSGSNVGIYFKKGILDNNISDKNLPPSKKLEWEDWWGKNKNNVEKAGKDFWNGLNN